MLEGGVLSAFATSVSDPGACLSAKNSKISVTRRADLTRFPASVATASFHICEIVHQSFHIHEMPDARCFAAPQLQSRFDAILAPSPSDASFAQATVIWISVLPATEANPQSLPTMMFSGPALFAQR